MRGRAGNANADADVRFSRIGQVHICRRAQWSRRCAVATASGRRSAPVQQNGEFVAAQTGRRVTLAQIGEKAAPNLLEQQVTGGVTKVIIDSLKPSRSRQSKCGRTIPLARSPELRRDAH